MNINDDYFLLFENSLRGAEDNKSFLFYKPIDIITAFNYQEVQKAYKKIEYNSKKHYIAGYFSYELGYYFDDFFKKYTKKYDFPLINLCVFDKIYQFKGQIPESFIKNNEILSNLTKNKEFSIKNLKLNEKKSSYIQKVNKIKDYISQGDTYQVNFTIKNKFDFTGSEFNLYQTLKNNQNVPYGAFLKFKDTYIISLSPELFFKKNGFILKTKPMKGTIGRGKNIFEDRINRIKLKNNEKERAENLMIVDLIRNDLGRISDIRTVHVDKLFEIEKYNTLHQMTSTISSKLTNNTSHFEIFKSLFPCGSVTGAPKLRTMEIIKELEKEPRNVYCGAIGMIFPNNKDIFNVPIRTVLINKNRGEMGIGSGITIDSSPDDEYDECLLKSRFFEIKSIDFELIETILWEKNYIFLNEHFKRMRRSAKYFNYQFHKDKISNQLFEMEHNFDKKCIYKVRLLLKKSGKFTIEHQKLDKKSASIKKIAISKIKIASSNVFLYHKTTNRQLYINEYKKYSSQGYYDVIFMNDKNEITEGSFNNTIIKMEKELFTPPVKCGLLSGIYRNNLLREGKIKEKIISIKDLKTANKIYLCNSVRGMVDVDFDKEIETCKIR